MQKRGIAVIILFAIMLSIVAYAADEDADEYCPGLGGTTATGAACPPELDCNDNNPAVNPAAAETPGDSIDNDCNGIVDDACTDSDNDGFNSTASEGGVSCGGAANVDCDDANFLVNPGMAEVCGDDIDNDCNGDTDEDDSACAAAAAESDCEIDAESVSWISCNADPINSANDGDTVYMIIMGEGCDEEADVSFKIYEHSAGSETLEDTIDALQPFTDIPDGDGNPTDFDAWIAPWVAAYMVDDDDTGPEYYFEAELTETGGAFFSEDSGKTADTLLSVAPCDGCGIECILDIGSMVGAGNGSSGGGIIPPCQKSIDCSNVLWSECGTSTGKMTRDTSLCTVSGTGTVQCEAQVKALAVAEKLCSSSANPASKSAGIGEAECGDGICDETEDAETCPDDCGEEPAGGFPWLWVLIAVIAVGGATAGIIIVYKKKKKAFAGQAKPGEKKELKKEEMPFAAQKDLDAILAYIRAAKGKGYNDTQITEALKKAGWKDEQVKYAFNKINNPQQANNAATAQKPAQETAKTAQTTNAQSAAKPVQQAAQPVKK